MDGLPRRTLSWLAGFDAGGQIVATGRTFGGLGADCRQHRARIDLAGRPLVEAGGDGQFQEIVFAKDDAGDAQLLGDVVLAMEVGNRLDHPLTIVLILLCLKAKMGHLIKIQRVERATTKSYYVNFPAALAEAAQIEKGEEFEWLVEDKNAFLLRRKKPKNSILKRSPPVT